MSSWELKSLSSTKLMLGFGCLKIRLPLNEATYLIPSLLMHLSHTFADRVDAPPLGGSS
jgi:hypothetical protein